MNDIVHASKMFDFIIYADDTALHYQYYTPISDILNNELSMVNNWLKVNKLSLNINERKYMIFHIKRKSFNVYH